MNHAVAAINDICGVIGRVNDISTTSASAVEEQTATRNEIARNVSEAARGAADMERNITEVAQSAKSTTSGATEAQAAAMALSSMATELVQLVHHFKAGGGGGARKPHRRRKRACGFGHDGRALPSAQPPTQLTRLAPLAIGTSYPHGPPYG